MTFQEFTVRASRLFDWTRDIYARNVWFLFPLVGLQAASDSQLLLSWKHSKSCVALCILSAESLGSFKKPNITAGRGLDQTLVSAPPKKVKKSHNQVWSVLINCLNVGTALWPGRYLGRLWWRPERLWQKLSGFPSQEGTCCVCGGEATSDWIQRHVPLDKCLKRADLKREKLLFNVFFYS